MTDWLYTCPSAIWKRIIAFIWFAFGRRTLSMQLLSELVNRNSKYRLLLIHTSTVCHNYWYLILVLIFLYLDFRLQQNRMVLCPSLSYLGYSKCIFFWLNGFEFYHDLELQVNGLTSLSSSCSSGSRCDVWVYCGFRGTAKVCFVGACGRLYWMFCCWYWGWYWSCKLN